MTMVLIVDIMIQVIAVIILTTTKAAEATARMTGPIVVMATVLMDVRLVILLSALQKICHKTATTYNCYKNGIQCGSQCNIDGSTCKNGTCLADFECPNNSYLSEDDKYCIYEKDSLHHTDAFRLVRPAIITHACDARRGSPLRR